MRTALALLLAAASLVGCQDARVAPEAVNVATRVEAPPVMIPTSDGPVALSGLHGSPVVLQFADAAHVAAWAALADATPDLEASGAVVLAVETDAHGTEAAEAFGYDGRPLAVVVDGEGTVRGMAEPTSGDAVFALAAPVLAEADLAVTVAWEGADTLGQLVAAGGLVIDLRPDSSAVPNALAIRADALTVEALPADLGTPLAFMGEGAGEAAHQAISWGYAAVFVVEADRLREVIAEPPARDDWRPRRGGVRG